MSNNWNISIAGWNIKLTGTVTLENWTFFRKLNVYLPCDPAKKICTRMFKHWEHPMCSLTGECRECGISIHTMAYSSVTETDY